MQEGNVSAAETLSVDDALALLMNESLLKEGFETELEEPSNDWQSLFREDIRSIVAGMLEVESDELPFDKPLLDFGLDSILSTELGAIFQKKFDISIPPTIFFEFQDLDAFCNYVVTNHSQELIPRYPNAHSSIEMSKTVVAQTEITESKSEANPQRKTINNNVIEETGSKSDGFIGLFKDDIAARVCDLLELNKPELSFNTPLLEYGLDSIASTELGNQFNQQLGISIPPTTFFEFQDLDSFCNYVIENYNDDLKKYYVVNEENKEVSVVEKSNVPVKPTVVAKQTHTDLAKEPGAIKKNELVAIAELWQEAEIKLQEQESRQEPLPGTNLNVLAANIPSEIPALKDELQYITFSREGYPNVEFAMCGKGVPILLIGGLVMQADVMWRFLIPEFREKYRLIMFHQPGCKGSDIDENLTLERILDNIVYGLEQLNLERVILVGYSFGGLLAQKFILEYPQYVSRLALVCTQHNGDGADDFSTLMRELQKSQEFMQHNRGWNIPVISTYNKLIKEFSFEQRLPEIKVPTLIICGGDDTYTPAAASYEMADMISGSELVNVPDAGHVLGFTHWEQMHENLFRFFEKDINVIHSEKSLVEQEKRKIKDNVSVFKETKKETLEELKHYVSTGQMGHCAILSPVAAQLGYLINLFLKVNIEKDEEARHCFFMPSGAEALDAAMRLARHNIRNKNNELSANILFYEAEVNWENYFDPTNAGKEDALVPGINFIPDLTEIEYALIENAPKIQAGAVVISSHEGIDIKTVEKIFAYCNEYNIKTIWIENQASNYSEKLMLHELEQIPDLVVFGEWIADNQVSIGICVCEHTTVKPWLMTPNEGYIRNVLTNLGFGISVAKSCLLRHVEWLNKSSVIRDNLNACEEDQAKTYSFHERYVNPGYAKVARVHGFDARFESGKGTRAMLQLTDEEPRPIIEAFANVGSSPRGLNPQDLIKEVSEQHRAEVDYWQDLTKWFQKHTGFSEYFPAMSNVNAVDVGMSLALLAMEQDKKFLFFVGGLGFSLISAAGSRDGEIDFFSKPFQPLFNRTEFVDATAENAYASLEQYLTSGEIGAVWFETIQIDANATTALPIELIELINKYHKEQGYLICVDETQTGAMNGRLLHSSTLIPDADIIAMSTVLCDSIVSNGIVMSNSNVVEKAKATNATAIEQMKQRFHSQFLSHIALHCLNDIEHQGLLERARAVGEYFKNKIREISADTDSLIKDVRGEGLLVTIELELSNYPQFIKNSFGYILWGACLRDKEFGVKTAVCPLRNNCLRYLVPLTITTQDVDIIVDNLRRVLAKGVNGVMLDTANYLEAIGDKRTASYFKSLTSS